MERLRAAEFRPKRKTQERLEKKTARLLKDWGVNGKWQKLISDTSGIICHIASWGSISKLHSYSEPSAKTISLFKAARCSGTTSLVSFQCSNFYSHLL